jgi:hypothetical protein
VFWMINLIGTVGNSFLFISSRMKVLLHNCVCVVRMES